MNSETVSLIIEIAGYVGMAFVVCSFFMKNIKWLRLLNVIGSVICATYGFLTKTYPTAALNVILFTINISFPIRYVVVQKKAKKDIE